MGATSIVFMFDHAGYLDRMVPAMRRFHATGEMEPWLRESWRTFSRGTPSRSRASPRASVPRPRS